MTIPPFRNPALLTQALTHRSAVNERRGARHNERMEFLGDAVLELIVSDDLYRKYPNKSEGDLTLLRTALVRTETLASVAVTLGIPANVIVSRGERPSDGKFNQSLLADTMEAVIGAVYLDGGFSAAQAFIRQTVLFDAENRIKRASALDTKSQYQELVQAKGHPSPQYRIIKNSGPDHNRVFTANVLVSGRLTGSGKGKSKQEAEQAAARNAMTLSATKSETSSG